MNRQLLIALAAAALAPAAGAAQAAEVDIRDAVVRVVVVPEDRADVAVEITPGRAAELPELTVTRQGADVRIDGGLRRRIRSCEDGPDGPVNPTALDPDLSVRVRGLGEVRLVDAPLVTVRTPMDVAVRSNAVAWGAIGRARSVRLDVSGCGDWSVGNTEGELRAQVSGAGDIHAGSAASLNANVSGAGDIVVASVRGIEADLSGAGDILVRRLDGPARLNVSGAGDIVVAAGSAPTLTASVSGVGDIEFRGVAGDVDARVSGLGDVEITRATGRVNRRVSGMGKIEVGG